MATQQRDLFPSTSVRAAGSFGKVVSGSERPLRDLVKRAAIATDADVAMLSFLDGDIEWCKSCEGAAVGEWPRTTSLWAPLSDRAGDETVPINPDVQVIPVLGDLSGWMRHPLHGEVPELASAAMAPVLDGDGLVAGMLAVFHLAPHEYSQPERESLANLARLVSTRLMLQRSSGAGEKAAADGPAPAETRPARPSRAKPDAAPPKSDTPGTKGRVADTEQIDQGALASELQRLNQQLEEETASRQSAQSQLQRERSFSDAAIAALPGAFYMFNQSGRMLRWNRNFTEVSGYDDGEIAARKPVDFVIPEDQPQVMRAIAKVFSERREVTIEARFQHKSGEVAPYLFTGRPVELDGELVLIGVGRDISDRKRAEQQLMQTKERLHLALTGSGLAMWDWDLSTNTVYFNEGWALLLGSTTREAIHRGTEVFDWNHPDDKEIFRSALAAAVKGESDFFTAEYRVQNDRGQWVWIHTRGKVTERDGDGQATRMTGVSENITERKAAEERAEFLATRDPLTGLPNRMLLNDRLEQGIAAAARSKKKLAFMFIDLDRFKFINDSLGHHIGDELLKQVATRLTSCVRATDTVARLGGDEFAVILEELKDEQGAKQVAENMIAGLAAPIFTGNLQLNTSGSIGIGVFPDDGRDSATLMKNADAAMYHAKEKGRNNFQFFSADMNTRVLERLSIENYLRKAVHQDELVLYYQPRVDFETGEMVGVEALLRWRHPRRGLLTPDKFISVAEESGLIIGVGEWVLNEAMGQVHEWQRAGLSDLKVSVNLSVSQIRDGDAFMAVVEDALKRTGLNPRFLELELTETLLMQNIKEKTELLNRLGEKGISLSIDDFGTGYSSLYYLKTLPVDSVKIDGSFVRDIVIDPNDEAIIRAIVAMAHSMQLRVVAEAVETDAQFTALKSLGCDEYQGYLSSAPLAVDEFEDRYLPGML
ncbi:MAG: EAL domain-containing protein [Burkholderiales bacterium]|nr:EAL domain-containing protein [Burkholderiales bacterium]